MYRRQILVMTVLSTIFSLNSASAEPGSFELLFSGSGKIRSFIYFKQDAQYFVDTDVNTSIDTFRYRNFYFNLHLLKETSMGRKYNSNMIFDPNRADYSFGASGRLEQGNRFFEVMFHHDSFHDIDRWEDNSVYWNSPRLGIGSRGFLPKYKYHQPQADYPQRYWQGKLDYYIAAGFYAPRGYVWQKRHNYGTTLQTDFRFVTWRVKRLGFDIESNSLWVLNREQRLESMHNLTFNMTLYGNRGAMMAYIGWWPHDNQMIRNRDGKTAFGIHLAF